MISIAKEVRNAQMREMERQELISFYLSALQISAKHALETPGRKAFVDEVKRLCDTVSLDSSPQVLKKSLDDFERCLATYCASIEAVMDHGSDDTKEIRTVLLLLKEAAGMMESTNKRVSVEVKEFTHQLEETLDCPDISTIRANLAKHVHQLNDWADTLRTESAQQLMSLQNQLQAYEDRLREVESSATIDSLTGVFCRREIERMLEERMAKVVQFSLIVVDLNNFKPINDKYGHRLGDQVLQRVAEKLKTSVRHRDHVGRWGGDEFVIIMDIDRSLTPKRCADISEQLQGRATFDYDNQHVMLDLSAAVGWAALEPGDTAASLFDRADLDMYKTKRAMRLEPARATVYAF